MCRVKVEAVGVGVVKAWSGSAGGACSVFLGPDGRRMAWCSVACEGSEESRLFFCFLSAVGASVHGCIMWIKPHIPLPICLQRPSAVRSGAQAADAGTTRSASGPAGR